MTAWWAMWKKSRPGAARSSPSATRGHEMIRAPTCARRAAAAELLAPLVTVIPSSCSRITSPWRGLRRRSAAEPCQERDGGIMGYKPDILRDRHRP